MNILSKIEHAGFLASEADVEALARDRQNTVDHEGKVNGTYLRVLLALTVADIALAAPNATPLSKRRGRAAAKKLPPKEATEHLAVFDAVATRCLAAVTRAVVTPDIAAGEGLPPTEAERRQKERNRRTGYARSAASTLRAYVLAGADVRDLDLATISKGQLRQIVARLRPAAPAVTVARLLKTATRDVERAVEDIGRLAALDSEQAVVLVNVLVEKLQDAGYRVQQATPPPLRRAA